MSTLPWGFLDWLITAMLFIVTVILVKLHISIQKRKKILKGTPIYPGGLPFIGHTHLATKFSYSGFVEEILKTGKENTNSMLFWLGPKLCGYVASPTGIEVILNRKDALDKGYLFSFFKAHSSGILTHSGTQWQKIQKLATVSLNHRQLLKSCVNIFQDQSKILIQNLENSRCKDYFDIYPYLSRCCQDITYESHFGVKLGIQSNKRLCSLESVTQSVRLILERMMRVWLFSDFIYFKTEKAKIFKKNVEHNQSIAKKIIEERKRILQEEKICQKQKEAEKHVPRLLDTLLSKENGFTEKQVTNELMDLMLTGFDSMALTQGWVLLLLAMYPQHQEKVHTELDEILSEGKDISLEDLQKCQYLDMVTKEALRLFGLPIAIRRLGNDVNFEHSTIPADTEVMVAMCLVHRNPCYWAHPDLFFPDHFLPERVAARPKYAFLPFGAGPRKCPGYAYAMIVVKFVVARLLLKYRFTTNQDFKNLPLDLLFMYKPANGFLLKYTPRKAN